ncbi:unnamed protein product [Cylindrotheca closterium]|uniref:Kinesin light chain n=1 Tax=Cylindrotheca closterium TaxID=2856 RepID=A0AAD2JPQ8_9STRA|nr:unnamed protein product [Cylindrotheca closterium]
MEDNRQESAESLLEKFVVYHDQQNYQKAKKVLEGALAIQTKDFGEDSVAVAATLYNLGIVLRDEGNLGQAIKKLNRALVIRLKKLGEKHADTVETYRRIGWVLQEQDNDDQAEEMFQKALDVQREVLPSDHPEVTELYQGLATSLKKQGKLSEAIKIHKLQLGALLQHGEVSPGVVLAYQGIAELLALQKRLDDALQMLDRAIEICDQLRHLGELGGRLDIIFLGRTLHSKGEILKEQRNFEAATEVLKRLLMLQLERVGEMSPATAGTYESLAQAYLEQNMIEDAIKASAKAINIRRRELGIGHPHVKKLAVRLELLERDKNIIALNEEGLARHAEGDSKKAMQLYYQAIYIYKKTCTDSPSIGAVFESISAIKVDQGLLEEAIAASAAALKIRRRTQGDDHPDTKRRMEEHRSLLKRLLENRT